MNYTRAIGFSPALRRGAFSPKPFRNAQVLRSAIHRRTVQTQSLKPEDGTVILNTQRLARPSSPHFTIYQPQLTWVGSIANRVTGVGLSVLLYGFSLAYLVAPTTFSSANIIELAAGLPEWVKVVEKTVLAAPFAFHSLNGLRHLAWDSGKFLSLKGAYRTGYAVLGATAISTVALVLW
ncbi:succinate dehydrogenase cytochrome b560 subunit [Lactarius quietus]|nr:succinate dehydrogenase cytochrome b560 subunit [Lactarius quietus]